MTNDMNLFHLTESDIAISRAQRITAKASTPDDNDDFDGYLYGAIQRWWMMHRRLVVNRSVREAFADAVDASLQHFEFTGTLRSLIYRLVRNLRDCEPDIAFAVARGLMVQLGLDPDATVLSQHRTEWACSLATVDTETDREAATYLAILSRQAVLLIADPETPSDQRSEICTQATESLRAIASSRAYRNELWTSVANSVSEFFGDDDASRVARLALVIEVLGVIGDGG